MLTPLSQNSKAAQDQKGWRPLALVTFLKGKQGTCHDLQETSHYLQYPSPPQFPLSSPSSSFSLSHFIDLFLPYHLPALLLSAASQSSAFPPSLLWQPLSRKSWASLQKSNVCCYTWASFMDLRSLLVLDLKSLPLPEEMMGVVMGS